MATGFPATKVPCGDGMGEGSDDNELPSFQSNVSRHIPQCGSVITKFSVITIILTYLALRSNS